MRKTFSSLAIFLVPVVSKIMRNIKVIFLILFYSVDSYPQGLPTDTCDTISPVKTPLQVNDSPYVLLQTALSYKPGQVINVNIQRRSTDSTFEGFMVQALDKISGRYIGRFLEADGLFPMDECSAVMHRDTKQKSGVHLAWVAPLNQRGDVIFRGIIIEKKTKFYDGLLSRLEPQRTRRKLF
ncbi:putative defense protein Hdd11-like isoform X1 [Parasteatoda tepidariorum]|uniref:putative defense protein Hdd11-like isoform X1 n=1 Tax=Parasteatoda tepidariorum TaxID=114398 RepID=UPI001C719DAA|nr:putative defense protein 3 [Parasteatoda tepidariorum]